MLQGMICQISEKLAERLRPVEGVTGKQFFDLSELKRFLSHRGPPTGHCNTKVTLTHLLVRARVVPRNRIKPLDTYPATQKADRRHHKCRPTDVWVFALVFSDLLRGDEAEAVGLDIARTKVRGVWGLFTAVSLAGCRISFFIPVGTCGPRIEFAQRRATR